MYMINFDYVVRFLGKLRYEVNCTFTVAHDRIAYMDVGEGCEHGAVSFVTPWNRQKTAPVFLHTLHPWIMHS